MLRKPPWSVNNRLVDESHDRYNAVMNDRVRSPIVAGTFYPRQPDQLRQMIDSFLVDEKAGVQEPLAFPTGLISPHAGYVYSGSVAGAGFQEVAKLGRPDIVIILGASHTGIDPWFSLSPHSAWATPIGQSLVDSDVVSQLVSAGFQTADAPFAREHSIEVQLPFIQHLWGAETRIVPICIVPSPLHELREAARALVDALEDRKALIVASSDFTHYQPDRIARTTDHAALDRIIELDIPAFHQLCQSKQLTICGIGAIELLLMVAEQVGLLGARLVDYATSGDATGDLSSVVGYASVLFAKENYG
ncbi:AmmeMemoRadiSam system protein B [Candidatus Bipolaricaulota bacterium]